LAADEWNLEKENRERRGVGCEKDGGTAAEGLLGKGEWRGERLSDATTRL
jgi:hypothetical protein